jgi:hypothetical protein
MRRSIALILPSIAMILSLVAPAEAGGVNVLDLDRYYYPVGASESQAVEAVLFRTVKAAERALKQSWSIYLIAEPRDWDDIRLKPGDPRIGTLRLQPGSVNGTALASFAFTVPQVPAGHYILALCTSAGCKTSVGDLYTSGIEVVESEAQARLLLRLDRMRNRQRNVGHKLREMHRDEAGLRRDVASNQDEIKSLTADRDALRARLRALEDELTRPASPVPWAIAAVLLAIVVMGAVRYLRPSARWERYFEPDEDTEPGGEEAAPSMAPLPSRSRGRARHTTTPCGSDRGSRSTRTERFSSAVRAGEGEVRSLRRLTFRPPARHHLGAGVEADAFRPVDVRISEQR